MQSLRTHWHSWVSTVIKQKFYHKDSQGFSLVKSIQYVVMVKTMFWSVAEQ